MSIVDFTDNSAAVEEAFEAAIAAGLTRCGMKARSYAVKLCPVDTGILRGSISYKVVMKEHAAYIGTNVEYAPYVELGTGKHATDGGDGDGGGGRPTGWVYQDAKGNWHYTHGQKPQPYLKPAVADHAQTYHNILANALKGK